MNSQAEREAEVKIEETSEQAAEQARMVKLVKKPNNKRKLVVAGVVLAASAALALSQAVPLLRDGLGSSSRLADTLSPLSGESDSFDSRKQAPGRDESAVRTDSLNQPTTRSRENMAPAAPSGAVSEELAKNLEAKDKAANSVLPPLDERVVQPNIPDLGHGYNAPAYLIKTANLQLEVGDIQTSFAKISALTEKYHGYLIDSSLSNYENSQPGAELHLKLPADKLSAALVELDALGTVRNKQIKTEDIWLQLKSQELEVDHLQGQAQAIKPGNSKRDLQYQVKKQQLEQLRLEQMLRMATVDLHLAERSPFWDLRPIGEELRTKSFASLQATTRLLAQVLLFLPPLLIFLGLAWLGWSVLRRILVGKLALLSERNLGGIYVSALIFFPLCAAGPQGLGPVLLFGILLGGFWAARTLYTWARLKMAAKAVSVAETAS